MHVTHFWTLEGVGYADALFHSHLSCIGLLLLRLKIWGFPGSVDPIWTHVNHPKQENHGKITERVKKRFKALFHLSVTLEASTKVLKSNF